MDEELGLRDSWEARLNYLDRRKERRRKQFSRDLWLYVVGGVFLLAILLANYGGPAFR